MSRSTKKGPYIHASLLKKVQGMARGGEKRVIRTWSRASLSAKSASWCRSR